MKLLERIIASTLCAAVLTGVLTVAPFSVSAAEEQKNEQAVTSYVSEAEFEEETTAAAEQQTMAQTADMGLFSNRFCPASISFPSLNI